jgi:hypothetical protein
MTGHRRRGTSGLEPLRGVPPQQPCDNRRSMGSDPGQFRRRLPAPPIPLYHGSQETSSAPDQGDSETGTGKDEKDGEGRGRRRKNEGGRRRDGQKREGDEGTGKNEGGRRRDGQTTRQVTKGRERTKEDGEGTGVRPRSRSSRAVTRLARRLDSLVRESNKPARFAFGRFGSMQANASICKHRCRRMQAYASIDAGAMQHGCSTGAARVQERCCIDAEGANAGSASMLCTHSIALHAGESGIDGAGKRNMLAVCLHCLHFSEQRITARRGGKRGVRGEMRGIVRRVPTCGAFRCAAGGRREDEEDEKDYGERRQRRGIVRRVPTCGAFRRRRLRPIRPLLRHRC